MKEKEPEWSSSYKGVGLNKFRHYFKKPGQIVAAIDSILSIHPEYLIDRANMFRELSHRRGAGKPHHSALVEGQIIDASYKPPRRSREKRRNANRPK